MYFLREMEASTRFCILARSRCCVAVFVERRAGKVRVKSTQRLVCCAGRARDPRSSKVEPVLC